MPVKLQLAPKRRPAQRSSFGWRFLQLVVVLTLAVALIAAGVFAFFYHHYEQVVDDRLAAGPLFAAVAQIYAAPREVRPGQKLTAAQIAAELRHAGYNQGPELGSFQLTGDTILIKPGPQSFHSTDGASIDTTGGIVASILAENGAALRSYELEPQLITALSEDKNRTKRRLVKYADIPPRLVQAVTAIEDRSFFDHGGVDYRRIVGAIVNDLSSNRRVIEGGSTITMQLARGFFLTPERHIKRKLIEIMITYQLEARFSKQQIFEMYANQINLGQRGSYAVNGFGEASQAFFGKDMRQLDTAECALLAAIIQSPNRLNPYRHAERALDRRNLVLDSMVKTGAITESQAERAKAQPLRLAPANVDASEAPFFVDLVHEQLVQRLGDQNLANANIRIYTSLDPELQHAASEAVELGMKNVDLLVGKDRQAHKDRTTAPPQVALVALNPHTGQVLALVGGRNYGSSQLDHATAKRPTGSIFKPFVYAAAYKAAADGQTLGEGGTFTALTRLNDVPTTFTFDNGRQTYNPRDYKDEYHGSVTAIYALAHSLNNATISLGQQVGFENVAALARASGITEAKGTPAVALGSYSATPLDMAGAYTVFANNGVHLNPWLLASVRNPQGDIVADFSPEAHQVLDPRAAYLTQSLLEGVMNFGYGYVARQHGFTAPAAGKTGTSHDAWFAAYSSNLLCIVWVGNDDYTNINLTGAALAAPIWSEFMNRAKNLPQYSDMTGFQAPSGVSLLRIDKATNLPADASCPNDYTAAFLNGTAPQGTCSKMNENTQSLIQKIFGTGDQDPTIPAVSVTQKPDDTPEALPPDPAAPRKKSLLKKLFAGPDKPTTPHPSPTPPQ